MSQGIDSLAGNATDAKSQQNDICKLIAEILGIIATGNSDAINTLIKLLHSSRDKDVRLQAVESLGKIASHSSNAINALIELLQTPKDEPLCLQAAKSLGKIYPGNSTAIDALTELVHTSQDEFTCLDIAFSLGQIAPNNQEATIAIIHLLSTSQNGRIRTYAPGYLQRIIQGNLFLLAVAGLKNCITDYIRESDFDLYIRCCEVLWHCAQNMPYPDFYEAWHNPQSQILEFQNIDLNQLQLTEHTYSLAINLLSLKEETEQGAIAQKVCTKIYKHHAVKIPGKPPTVKNEAELQQHLFEIQDKLQRPNLALVLYIKDTNGFHEPTEEAIAFCQKLADPDLGVHIAWITNQHLESPLKNILPDFPKLITKIQSWIDEIV